MASVRARPLLDERGTSRCTCEVAETVASRTHGLLGRAGLDQGRGLLLRPASSVDAAFMRFPIDGEFLGRRVLLLKARRAPRPWRSTGCLRARAVLELAAGESARLGIEPGATLRLG